MERLTRYRNTASRLAVARLVDQLTNVARRFAGMQCDASQKTLPFTDNSEYVLNNANSEE